MGLLDDAIKEHLELKRRRGADAAEITRLESEALGPVRRSAEGVPDLPDTFVAPAEPSAGLEEPPQAAAPAISARPWEVDTPSEPPAAYEPPPRYEPPPFTPAPAADQSPVIPPPTREAWTDEPEVEEVAARDFKPEPESTGLLSRFRIGRRSKHDREPDREPDLAGDEADPFEPRPSAVEPPAPPPPSYAAAPPPSYAAAPPPVPHEPDIVPADEEPDVEDLLEETPEFLEETPEHDRLWFEQRPPRDFDFDG